MQPPMGAEKLFMYKACRNAMFAANNGHLETVRYLAGERAAAVDLKTVKKRSHVLLESKRRSTS